MEEICVCVVVVPLTECPYKMDATTRGVRGKQAHSLSTQKALDQALDQAHSLVVQGNRYHRFRSSLPHSASLCPTLPSTHSAF